jgi:hypothetical protein
MMSGIQIFTVLATFFAVRFILPATVVVGIGSFLKKVNTAKV